MLQIANVKEPNSKLNTFLLTMVACKDSHSNLKNVLKPYKKQIKDLQNTQWQGKQIRVFLFGDYDFLLKIYGLSGAQAVHPCLWCTASKQQTQRSATQQPDLPKRSLDSIRKDRQRFRLHGKNDIKKAKAYNNAIHDPLFDVPLTQVAPPYLHILLGISKKHHDILEKDCHALDKQIGVTLAEDSEKKFENKTQFGKFVNKLQNLKQNLKEKEKEMDAVGAKLIFDDLYSKSDPKHRLKNRKSLKRRYDELEQELDETEKELGEAAKTLPFLSGPVTANLDTVLHENKITVQAYHGRSFVGNHCHKYLQTSALESICQSVDEMTDHTMNNTNTDSRKPKETAHAISKKMFKLNSLYAKVHKQVSHMRPVTETGITQAEQNIANYMKFYRSQFPNLRIIPKQHILEHHLIDFMKRWHFGLALHGEQGGEETHAFVNELKVRVRGVNKEDDKLRLLMKEQLTIVSPLLRSAVPSSKKEATGLAAAP